MTDSNDNDRLRRSDFRPPWWLRNRHAQTIYPTLPWAWVRRTDAEREELDLPDGDATVVDWYPGSRESDDDTPLVVILHGLEGSGESSYARMLMHAADARGWANCVLHFRDCGNYANRLPRRYHAGETADLRFFIRRLRLRWARRPLAVVGYSLGGNVLLKYLGESADDTTVTAACAVCVPLDLHSCADALNNGFSKLYQYHLLRRMKSAVRRKFNPHTAAFSWERAMAAQTFAEFDDAVTAPLHGFAGRDDYYDRCSSIHFLDRIRRPTLIVNALDDPFMDPSMYGQLPDLPGDVTLELSAHGGHVGFVSGGTPLAPKFYLPGRICDFLARKL